MRIDVSPFRVVFYNPKRVAVSPGEEYLSGCPVGIRGRFLAALVEIAKAPPFRFRGGGLWEAMHGTMTGWFEVRINSGHREHYRLFCVLDHEAQNFEERLLVVISGRTKKYGTTLDSAEYRKIKKLGDEYFAQNPRLI